VIIIERTINSKLAVILEISSQPEARKVAVILFKQVSFLLSLGTYFCGICLSDVAP